MLKTKLISILFFGCFLLGVTHAFGREDETKLIEGGEKRGEGSLLVHRSDSRSG